MMDTMHAHVLAQLEGLRALQINLQTQIDAIDAAASPLVTRLKILQHRKSFADEAIKMIERLAEVCSQTAHEPIPF